MVSSTVFFCLIYQLIFLVKGYNLVFMKSLPRHFRDFVILAIPSVCFAVFCVKGSVGFSSRPFVCMPGFSVSGVLLILSVLLHGIILCRTLINYNKGHSGVREFDDGKLIFPKYRKFLYFRLTFTCRYGCFLAILFMPYSAILAKGYTYRDPYTGELQGWTDSSNHSYPAKVRSGSLAEDFDPYGWHTHDSEGRMVPDYDAVERDRRLLEDISRRKIEERKRRESEREFLRRNQEILDDITNRGGVLDRDDRFPRNDPNPPTPTYRANPIPYQPSWETQEWLEKQRIERAKEAERQRREQRIKERKQAAFSIYEDVEGTAQNKDLSGEDIFDFVTWYRSQITGYTKKSIQEEKSPDLSFFGDMLKDRVQKKANSEIRRRVEQYLPESEVGQEFSGRILDRVTRKVPRSWRGLSEVVVNEAVGMVKGWAKTGLYNGYKNGASQQAFGKPYDELSLTEKSEVILDYNGWRLTGKSPIDRSLEYEYERASREIFDFWGEATEALADPNSDL